MRLVFPGRRCCAAVVSVLLASCGGGNASAPTPVAAATPTPAPPAPAVPVVRHGVTEEPVGAEVAPAAPARGSRISVTAPGFLVRDQIFDGTPIFLWPGDLPYVHDLAYHEFMDGSWRTIRWAGPFTMTLDGDLADDPVLVAKAQEVAAELTRVTGLRVNVGPGGACLLALDPSVLDEDAIAIANWTTRGATIIGGRVRFGRRSEIAGGARADWPNTLLHEMGHIMGLMHSTSDRDVMTPGAGPGTKVSQFQPNEAACLRVMYAHRAPGNYLPDRDPAVGAASSAVPRHRTIVN